MQFKNPLNGYIEQSTATFSWLWCFLFGAIYFLVKGNWKHVFLYIIFAVCTLSISMFIYPFYVRKINDAKYLRAGWIPVTGDTVAQGINVNVINSINKTEI
tara:strand:+ start:509 stop:811 length:303 start_codon:yes stop_codon:yes gene_type:complete